MAKPIFSIIYHHFRVKNNLSMNEYVICDIIYHLSNNKNSSVSGWCFASKQHLGDIIGLSKRAIIDMVKRLLESDYLEINETNTQLLRTTKKWDSVYLTKDLQVGEETSPINNKSSLTKSEETSPAVQNLHQKYGLDDENDSAEFAPSVKKLHRIGEETSPYIYSYKDIKNTVYNSLKEKENFEKKSEKYFLNGRVQFLSVLEKSKKFNEWRVGFLDLDNQIFDTRCLNEVSIEDYSEDDNKMLSIGFILDAIDKVGCMPMKDERQLNSVSKSVLDMVLRSYGYLSWSELELATTISISFGSTHPLFDFCDIDEIPDYYNLRYFQNILKTYIEFRRALDTMICKMSEGIKPYQKEMQGVSLDTEIKIDPKRKNTNDI